MTRTSFTICQISLAWIALAIAVTARAEPLVRDYAGLDSTASVLRAATDAQFVRRLRGSDIAIVPVSDLLPTDRVMSCDDPGTVAGATTCPSVQPDRKDNWRLVAVLFPPQTRTDIHVRWKHPTDTTDLIGYRLLLRLQRCDLSVPPCVAASYEPAVDVGLVDSYSTTVPGEMHEVCVQILPRAEDREGEAVEACSRRPLGALTDVAVEFTSR
jgi:hypothetical protein